MIYYFDTSAVVKLVVAEDHSDEILRLWQEPDAVNVSSALLKTELLRAVKNEDAEIKQRARQVLATFSLIAISDHILESAAVLDPSVLRTLDAIHVASALSVGEDLAAVVAFDTRMAQAAANAGLSLLPAYSDASEEGADDSGAPAT